MNSSHLQMDFVGYNHVPIANIDQENTTFVINNGYFSYKVMSFRLNNAPIVFLNILVKAFQE